MVSRTVEVNVSLARKLLKYKIQIKVNNKWYDFKVHKVVKLFDNKYHANNYGKQLNPNHIEL